MRLIQFFLVGFDQDIEHENPLSRWFGASRLLYHLREESPGDLLFVSLLNMQVVTLIFIPHPRAMVMMMLKVMGMNLSMKAAMRWRKMKKMAKKKTTSI
jgi:hypothetical protein